MSGSAFPLPDPPPEGEGKQIPRRRALVTGGGRGIGRAIALRLAEAGADVIVSARSEAEIAAVAAEIEGSGRRGIAVRCDVTDPDEVVRLFAQAVDTLGGIDILVNNAGSGGSHKFIDHPDDLWRRMIDANLNSVYHVTRAFAPGMVERGWGRIINIASIAAKVGGRYIAAYTASKHGVLGLTRALAAEFAAAGVTVNAICPGYVDTAMTDASIANIVGRTGRSEADIRRTFEQFNPQGRLIGPEEVAAVAVFLAGDAAMGITGQAINVDGGMVMY